MLTLECFARAMRLAYLDRDRERGLYETFSWLVEEVGELAEALRSGDRGRVMEEIADVLAWTLSIANLMDLDVEEAVRLKYGRDLELAECLEGPSRGS
jgi:NTP pyrophosphatase (non-canonical NTP hydrolase)